MSGFKDEYLPDTGGWRWEVLGTVLFLVGTFGLPLFLFLVWPG